MPKQGYKSITVTEAAYDRYEAAAEKKGVSVSKLLETISLMLGGFGF